MFVLGVISIKSSTLVGSVVVLVGSGKAANYTFTIYLVIVSEHHLLPSLQTLETVGDPCSEVFGRVNHRKLFLQLAHWGRL